MANNSEIRIVISADGTAAIAGIQRVGDETEKLGSRTQSFTQAFKANWLEFTAGVTAAYLALQKLWGFMEIAANYAEAMTTLNALTRQYGTSAEQLVLQIQDASHGLIGMGDAASVANDALLKGFTPAQITQVAQWSVVMEHAKGGAITAAEAFRILTETMATGRERGAVKLLGTTIDLNAAYGAQAANMDKAQKMQAIFALAQEQMAKVQATLGEQTDSTADKMHRFTTEIENLKISVGDFVFRIGAAMFGVFQSIAGSISIIIGAIVTLFEASSWITDKLGITAGAAAQWRELSDTLRMSGEDLKKKAQDNFDLAVKGRAAAEAGTGVPLPPPGGDGNRKALEKLNEITRKYAEERDLIDAAEKDKELVRLNFWFDEQVKKLHDLGAGDKQYSALVVTYAEKRHDAIASWATKTSEFYLEVQRQNMKENDEIEKERNAALYKTAEDGVRERMAIADTYAKAWGNTDESDAIRRRAQGEQDILAIKQQGLLASITEQTTFVETLKIMQQYRDLENQIEESKRRQVVDLDARRIVVEQKILDLMREQTQMLFDQQAARAQDAFSKIGGNEFGTNLTTVAGIAAGQDQYTKDFDAWSKLQDQKIMYLEEIGASEQEIRDAYREYDLQQEAMAQQQKVAMGAATFGMLGSLATSLYDMQGKQGGAAFEAMKAFRIGETLMNTYSAAVGAYNALASIPYVGPALGAAAAAAAIAFGMAQVASISSMKPGGGPASASVGGLGGGTPSIPSAPAPATHETVSSPTVNIHIYGNVVDHDKFARELVPAITKAVADGVA